MPVEVSNGSNSNSYKFLTFSDGFFILRDEVSDVEIRVKTPLSLDASHSLDGFNLHFLAKKDVKESEIFQVHNDSGVRIGWCIPVISLASDDHEYAEDQHFLRYAYAAVVHSLNKADKDIYQKSLSASYEEISMTDIFDESTVLLILSKTNLDNGSFEFDRFSPALFKYGYTKLQSRNPNEIEYFAEAPNTKKLTIKSTSTDILNYQLISELLNFSVAYEKNAAFKFFYLYQILELLIENIYQNEQKIIINDLVSAQGDTGKTKDVLDRLQAFISEKSRIQKLENSYMSQHVNIDQLKSFCNQFLVLIGRKPGTTLATCLYPIRNFIFHQYRDFPKSDQANEIFEGVIKSALDVFIDMLASYKNVSIQES